LLGCGRDFGDLIIEHDVFLDDKRIGEINAEAARKVVIANSACTNATCLTGWRAEFWFILKSDSDDLCDFRRSKPEIAMTPISLHQEQARLRQLPEMVLAVCGVICAARASSLAVMARPSRRPDTIVALAESPTNAAISAMISPVIIFAL
jgi:hypothetical protein